MLREKIKAFEEKLKQRNTKINERIREIEELIKGKKQTIDGLMKALVQAELSDDTKAQKEINDKLSVLRQELADQQEKTDAYASTLKDTKFLKDDLEDLRKAAIAARKKRIEDLQTNLQYQKEVAAQIEELQKQLQDLESKERKLKTSDETRLPETVIKLIDARAEKIPHYQRDKFITAWLDERDLESFFAEKQQWEGPVFSEPRSVTREPQESPKPKPINCCIASTPKRVVYRGKSFE